MSIRENYQAASDGLERQQRNVPYWLPATTLAALLASCMLSACEQPNVRAGDSVVVAKVNADEITLGRVKRVLARTSTAASNQTSAAPEEIVTTMVIQSLAVEQARKLKLDLAPDVQAAVEEAKREILARAYYDHISMQTPPPSEEDIHHYYLAHPELFAHRCLYSLKEITLQESADTTALIKNARPVAKSVDELASWLRLRGIEFHVNSAIRAPESLPMDMLPKLASARLGDMIAYNSDNTAYVAQVVGLLEDPISETNARVRIRSYLENRQAKEAMATVEQRLRMNAKIEIRADLSNLLTEPQPSGMAPALALETRSTPSIDRFPLDKTTNKP